MLRPSTSNPKNRRSHESIAILLYIADKYDKEHKFSYAHGTPLYYEQLEWLLFQASGIAPAKGNLNFFSGAAAPQKIDFAIERYHDEVVRQFGVLEKQLKKNGTGFLVGDHISLADIATYPYVIFDYAPKFDEELKEFPLLSAWAKKIGSLPEVINAKQVPK
ncbi:unnamed protein product [Ambrosiozyma monospora]|uniref:Unnamed protein product n=1 Tax=Ambrosiozyma monospora TaxID=43982 RepID=A0A9W6Z6X6_AMBMO|nr:unnamed protein product [Ambrosiozyma monospora]